MEEFDEERCTICLDTFGSDEQNILTLDCGHKFHKNCILNWFRRRDSSGNCPLCNDNPHGQNRPSQYFYYNQDHVKLYNNRYNLIKRKLLKNKDEKANKTEFNIINRINSDIELEKELNDRLKLLQKNETYKQMKKDISDTRKKIWATRKKIISNKIKIVSKHPVIFL